VFRLREREEEEEEDGASPSVAAASAAAAAGGRRRRRTTTTVVELCEVAPGIDVERDVLGRMAFRPAIPKEGVRVMDARVLEGV
jgi:MYXO-CTERM domain-containing protein